MKSYLDTSVQRSTGNSIEFNFNGNGKNWFLKDANVNTDNERIPTMSEMFKNHHVDMFKLLDTNNRGDSINLDYTGQRDTERNVYATGGNVATSPTTPSWTEGAQPMASGGDAGQMVVNWGNGQRGRVVR